MQQQKGTLLTKVLVNQDLFPTLANILTEVYFSAHSVTTRSNILTLSHVTQVHICIASYSTSRGKLGCLGYSGLTKETSQRSRWSALCLIIKLYRTDSDLDPYVSQFYIHKHKVLIFMITILMIETRIVIALIAITTIKIIKK